MPIRATNGPEGGGRVIADAIAPLFDGDDDPTSPITAAAAGDGSRTLQVAAPHPVFVATLEDVVDDRLLAAASQNGWRYLLLRDGKAVASANVNLDEETGGPEFSHVSEGPYVESTVDAIGQAEDFAEVKRKDFDLRLLEVPPLTLRALWLHSHGADDILVPLYPAPPGVDAYKKYSEAELVGTLRGAAQEQLQHPGYDED